MPNIGPMELAIVLVIALVVFGPKRLPELGRSLGSGMRGFKESLTAKADEPESGPVLEPRSGSETGAPVSSDGLS